MTEDSHLIKLDDTALASLTVAPAAKDKIKSLAAQEAAWQDEANRNASLMQAARNQDLATVKALLDKKVNIFAQDAAG